MRLHFSAEIATLADKHDENRNPNSDYHKLVQRIQQVEHEDKQHTLKSFILPAICRAT